MRKDQFKPNGPYVAKRLDGRVNAGAVKLIEDAQAFWDIAAEYFQWADENPLHKYELIKSGDLAGRLIEVPLGRPYTWKGLNAFVRMKGIMNNVDHYIHNTNGRYDDFVEVVAYVRNIIEDQKFSGAAVNVFNANIIAKDLGLAEKRSYEVSGEFNKPIIEWSEEDAQDRD